jgi:methionine--tRNA ligase beta chain
MTNETPMPQPTPQPGPQVVQYGDFAKLEFRVGTVLEVSDHPNADKLLVLKVDLGDQQRQIIAGLRGYVSHEQLLGSQVAIVANLAPRKMRGLESQGMILAASYTDAEGKLHVVPLTVMEKTAAGAKIS